ncbi:virion structural protein [Pseudomonas phage Noxifer]|uniref:Virion structural protein n=1 Tax=Pseudomonas phage Noxifer TaxID=2006684 RepID=A0A1Y0SV24_9CAUD|nr:virion structural protein [Pseudomonas phage Noxifer]ARV77250.1 virion structural protein [Pseudomonas phage Noxifer]
MIEMMMGTGPKTDGPFVPPDVVAGKAFKGWVPAASFITGDALAEAIGLTAGTPHNSDAGWLHYIDGAREFYIARTTLRYGLTWRVIETANANNTKAIKIGNDWWMVKQITGMSVNPFSNINSDNGGGDWDKYIYPLIAGPARAQITAEVWSYYTEKDLGLSPIWGTQPNGSITHTADKHTTLQARAARGRNYNGGVSVSSVTGRTVYNEANAAEGNAGTGLNQYGWRPILEKTTEPATPNEYLGEFAAASLITGADLTTAVGAGGIGADLGAMDAWLGYKINGKTLYLAKKPIRYGVTWNQLNAIGCVFGVKTVVIGGKTYKVRLPTGANKVNPGWFANDAGGEFNDMLYPVYNGVAAAQPQVQAYPRWAAFTDAQLNLSINKSTSANPGVMTLCQEQTSAGDYLVRGYNDADNAGNAQILAGWHVGPNAVFNYTGWRPVLELVP